MQVIVHPLGPFTPIPADLATSGVIGDSLISADLVSLPAAGESVQTVPAQAYAWGQDDGCLDKEPWSFDEFVQKSATRWIDHAAGPPRN